MTRNGSSTSKISVWWDIENCHVPRNVDPHYIAQNLRLALHQANLNGPITIDVFGDTKNLDHKTLEALSSTGITINHIPSGNKDAADKAILVAMLFWALDNAPPAHFLLISGDGDFANALHRLRLKGYDILLARPDQPVKPALLGAATSIWYWTNVAKGQIPVPEEVKKIYEESSGRLSSNKMGNDDFVKVDPYKQSLPKVFSQHNRVLSGAFGVSSDEGIQSLNQRTAPLQESARSGKCQRDTSPTGASHPWVSDRGVKTSMSYEDMRTFDEDAAKFEPFTKQPSNQGHQPMRLGDEKTDLSKQSCDKHGIPFVSSNKITDHTKAPPSPTVAEPSPSLSQDAYNSNILKVMKSFERLKLDGLVPTQGYLQDCLCYWDKQHGKVNLKQVLDQAMHLQHIEKVPVGEGGFTYFLPRNTGLWNCFNIGDMMYAFSNELWKDFHQFLCCSKNWQFFVHSKSMYEAAQRLKSNGHSGIRDLAVGQIVLFLNQAIRERNWLSLEITPTFVLSIKSQVVMEQNPSEGIRSSTSRVPKDDQGFMAKATSSKGSAEVSSLFHKPTKLLILKKLRTWLMEISQTRPDYDVSLVPKDFQQATGIYLDIQKLGFEKLQGLIEEFDDVVTIKVARKGLKILCPAANVNRLKGPPTFETFHDKLQRAKPAVTTNFTTTFQDKVKQDCPQPPAALNSQGSGVSQICFPKTSAPDGPTASKDVAQHAHHPPTTTSWNAGAFQNSSEKAAARNHPTLKKLRNWLLQLPSLNHGYDLSLIKRDFHEATGIVLDPPSLGYPKVKDILNIFPKDFHVESPRKGLYLLFGNKKGMSAMKSNPGSNTHHPAEQTSGHVVGEEVTSKPAQKSAANKSSSMQWKELHPTFGVNDGEVNKTAVGATTFVLVATSDVQH